MIINNNKSDKEILIEGDSDVKVASISARKQAKLQKLLTKNLYEDPETAVIAELTNNAIDAIVASGKDPIENPVIVNLSREYSSGEYFLSIKDNGVGLSKWEFENIFMNYLESTKEDDNEQLGHFGLGGKSPLALNRSYRVISSKDGIKTTYLIWEGKMFTEWDVVSEVESSDTGVEVIVPINDRYEFNNFCSKAKQKLAYYDTVCLMIEGNIINNEIIRSEDWQYSNQNRESVIHFCLKDVFYEIDYHKLGIPEIHIPIALRFDLKSNICPTPSREGIIWDKDTVELFKSKIAKVADWFVHKYNEDNSGEFDSIIDAWQHINNNYYQVKIQEKYFNINYLLQYTDKKINPITVKGLENTDLKFYTTKERSILNNYEVLVDLNNYGVWKTKRIYTEVHNAVFSNSRYKYKIIQVNEVPKGNLKQYLLEKHGNSNILFVKKIRNRKLGDRNADYRSQSRTIDYRFVLNLAMKSKNLWRESIKEWQFVEKQFENLLIDERNCEIPQQWLDNKKELQKANRERPDYVSKKLDKKEGDIVISVARSSEHFNSKTVFDKQVTQLSKLQTLPHLFIYSSNSEDKEILSNFFQITKKLTKIKFILVGKRDSLQLTNNSKFKTMSEFKNSKPFSRIVTAIYINQILEKYRQIYDNKIEIVEKCLKKFNKEITELKAYLKSNPINIDSDSEEAGELLAFAKENNLFDNSVLYVIKSLEAQLNDFSFLSILDVPHSWNRQKTEEYTKFVKQFMLYQKLYKNSHKQFELVEIPQVEEELTEQE